MIKTGTKLRITHTRKGVFECVATKDFEPENETFFPVRLISQEIHGMTKDWVEGEEIPCRSTLVTKIEKV